MSHPDFCRRTLYNAIPLTEDAADRLIKVCTDLEGKETVRLAKAVRRELKKILSNLEDIEK